MSLQTLTPKEWGMAALMMVGAVFVVYYVWQFIMMLWVLIYWVNNA